MSSRPRVFYRAHFWWVKSNIPEAPHAYFGPYTTLSQAMLVALDILKRAKERQL